MRNLFFILIACSMFIACKKKDEKFCYTCTQKVTYRATATSPAYSILRSSEYCDKTYKDIVTLEEENRGVEAQDSTTYQLECVRQQ